MKSCNKNYKPKQITRKPETFIMKIINRAELVSILAFIIFVVVLAYK